MLRRIRREQSKMKERQQERHQFCLRTPSPPDQKTSPGGKSATLQSCSWNVDGLQAWIKKEGLDWSRKKPQISCASERPNVQRTNYRLNFMSYPNYPISPGEHRRTRKGTGYKVQVCSPTSTHSKSPMALGSWNMIRKAEWLWPDLTHLFWNSWYTQSR